MSYSPHKRPRTEAAFHIRETIRKELLKLKRTYPEREEYIPEEDLSRWITWDAIKEWIQDSGIEDIGQDKMADDISKFALKTFCILMEIEREDSIEFFIWHNLPSSPDMRLPWLDSCCLAHFLQDAGIFNEWSQEKCEEFFEKQWKYLVPKFHKGQQTRIPKNAKLPFLKNAMYRDTEGSRLFHVDFDGRYLLSAEGEPSGSTDKVRVSTCLSTCWVVSYTLPRNIPPGCAIQVVPGQGATYYPTT